MYWCPSTVVKSVIHSYRLLSVAEPTFILITKIAATFTWPYTILKGFQQLIPGGSTLSPWGPKSDNLSGFSIYIGDIVIACPNCISLAVILLGTARARCSARRELMFNSRWR